MIETYFVHNGWLNGVVGEYATTISVGVQQKDGWYYLRPDDEDGTGPFESEAAALRAAEFGED